MIPAGYPAGTPWTRGGSPAGSPTERARPEAMSAEKLRRVSEQVKNGYYAERDVLRDVADALIMNPAPFEALNEKEEE